MTATLRSTRKAFRYLSASGALPGRTGAMIAVMRPPTTASRKILVCMRPFNVGTTSAPVPIGSLSGVRALWKELRLPVGRPAQPLPNRTARPYLLAESTTSQVVGDLLSGDLQAEEGVHAGKV